MQNKKILVTGGAGAVGTNLIKRLILKGADVTSWDNYSVGKEENHFPYCNYQRIDTNEAAEAFNPEFDLVFHLGEYSKVVPSFDEVANAFDYNIKGSFKLLEQCKKFNV